MAALIQSIAKTNTKTSQGSGRKCRKAIRKDVPTSKTSHNELTVGQMNVHKGVGLLDRSDNVVNKATEHVDNVDSSQNHRGIGQMDVGDII